MNITEKIDNYLNEAGTFNPDLVALKVQGSDKIILQKEIKGFNANKESQNSLRKKLGVEDGWSFEHKGRQWIKPGLEGIVYVLSLSWNSDLYKNKPNGKKAVGFKKGKTIWK